MWKNKKNSQYAQTSKKDSKETEKFEKMSITEEKFARTKQKEHSEKHKILEKSQKYNGF